MIEDGSQARGARHAGRPTTEAGYMLASHGDVYYKAALGGQDAGMTRTPGRTSERGFPAELLRYSDSLIYTYRASTVNCVPLREATGEAREREHVATREPRLVPE